MSDTTMIIVAVVALVLVLLAIGLAVRASRKKTAEANRGRAAEVRSGAATETTSVEATRREAGKTEARAEHARLEAETAEAAAAEADRDLKMDQARLEDQMRTADRIDPDVNHRASDYTPTTPTVDDHPDRSVTVEDGTTDKTTNKPGRSGNGLKGPNSGATGNGTHRA